MLRQVISSAVVGLCAIGCSSEDPAPATPPTPDGGKPLGAPVVIPDLTCDTFHNADKPFPNVQIGGREVIIDYPCNKPSGSPMTFILHLHGTQSFEAFKVYQRSYIKSQNFVDSHNFLIATPKSVVSQWGNGDNGQDEPHVLEVIDWVYTTFKDFDIKNMWVAGHSWGAVYTLGFVCKPELESKVSGAILMSGAGVIPACANRLALIGSVGETDIVPGELAQADIAAAHGCDAEQVTELGNNRVTEFPNCDPPWVHKSYFMRGKGHGFDPIDWPDEEMSRDIAVAILKVREGS
jgi:pimeloyl-ACP methyl ester carboxylesterase